MDYIALNARRSLRFGNGQLAFRDPLSVGAGNIAEFVLSDASSGTIIWDVTNPINVMRVGTSPDGAGLRFRLPADELRELVAYDGSSYYSAQFVGKVPNQNLHAIAPPDLMIISHMLMATNARI